jgi:hypothetical protein
MITVTFYNAQKGTSVPFTSEATTFAALMVEFESNNLNFDPAKQKLLVTAVDKSVVSQSLEVLNASVPTSDYVAMVLNKESKAGALTRREIYTQVREVINSVENIGDNISTVTAYFNGDNPHWTNQSNEVLLELIEAFYSKVEEEVQKVEEVEVPIEVEDTIQQMLDVVNNNSRSLGVDISTEDTEDTEKNYYDDDDDGDDYYECD